MQQSLKLWQQHRKQSSKLLLGEFFRAFHPILPLLAGTVNYLLPVGGMLILISTVLHFSTMTYGLQVQYNGEHIGYILSESAFVEAEAKVRERIVNEAYLPPEDSVPIYSLAIVEDDQISEESVLINNIIRASGNEIEEAAGLYVDGEFIGAVSDGDELLKSLRARKTEPIPLICRPVNRLRSSRRKRQNPKSNRRSKLLPTPSRKTNSLPPSSLFPNAPIRFVKVTRCGILPLSTMSPLTSCSSSTQRSARVCWWVRR